MTKFALIGDKKSEPTKGAKGLCPACGAEMVAKCGQIKVHHWAHKSKQECDSWWERESPWHREWKDNFPLEWQEIVQRDERDEKHIADVKTTDDWVIEFQHSRIDPSERQSREIFYQRLIWVVDGLRLRTDKTKFLKILGASIRIKIEPHGIPSAYVTRDYKESRFLLDWVGSNALVFLDFQEKDEVGHWIWLIIPYYKDGNVHLWPLLKSEFIEHHRHGTFNSHFLRNLQALISSIDDGYKAAKIQRQKASQKAAEEFANRMVARTKRRL